MLKLVCLLFLAAVSAQLEDFVDVFSVQNEGELGYRLPDDTFPLRYDITLTTHVHRDDLAEDERFLFEGEVLIHLKARTETSTITLQKRRSLVQKAELWDENSEEAPRQTWTAEEVGFDEKFEFLTFNLTEPLAEDEVVILQISYTAYLRNDDSGFYRSSYLDESGKRRWLATTQFEQTDARHAFPCYDEPGIRAIYGITIIHGSEYFAVANSPVRSKEPADMPGYTKTVFEDTPVMQSYLVCFVISDYTFVEVHGRIPQRVFAKRQSIEAGHADMALRAGVDILRQIDTYFDQDYAKTAPKLDQIAIPDFFYGAMENWGLVTYRETALLFNEKTDTISTKFNIISTIAHEYAHQYFGNLVCPKWWSYIWLNEGFANLYGYLAVAPVYPELDASEIFQLTQLQGVLQTDGFGETRPMTKYVEAPQDVRNLFDSIAYPKCKFIEHAYHFEIANHHNRGHLT